MHLEKHAQQGCLESDCLNKIRALCTATLPETPTNKHILMGPLATHLVDVALK